MGLLVKYLNRGNKDGKVYLEDWCASISPNASQVYNRFGRRYADPDLKDELAGLQRQCLKDVLGNLMD